ncbi:MAG: hypothetical protein CMF52_07700 [Legionellales bacterium]|nr:hypothetical protein [Legionellales bacterium]HAV93757.1 hypothetical protein [Pseudomonadota bacterium]
MISLLSMLISLLAITNPIGNAAIFVSMTQGVTRDQTIHIALKTAIAVFFVLQIAVILFYPLSHAMGISMSAFRFAGGLILMKVGFSLFSGTTDHSNFNPEEHKDQLANMAITPLAIPLIAGPGAMVAAIHHADVLPNTLPYMIGSVVIIAVAACIIGLCLYATTLNMFAKFLSKKSIVGVITRICGLIILAIASQMVLDAVKVFMS